MVSYALGKDKEDTTEWESEVQSGMKAQTVKYKLGGGKSASKVAVEIAIDKNTVCRWVRKYREAHQMPTYEVGR